MPENLDFSTISAAAIAPGANVIANEGSTPSTPGITLEALPLAPTAVPGSPTPEGEGVLPPSPQPLDASGSAPAEQPAEPTYVVDLGNGKTETFTRAQILELQKSGLRQADYTRKTQEAAHQRAQLEAEATALKQYQQQVAYAQHLLSNPALMAQVAQQQLATLPATPTFDPDAPVTAGQLQAFAKSLQESIAVSAQTQQQQAALAAQNEVQTNEYRKVIQGTLEDVYKTYPLITNTPNHEDILRFEVAKLNPQTVEEANAAFVQVAKDWNDRLENAYKARTATQNASRAQLVKQNIEPPGGVAVAQPKPNYMNGKDANWNALRDAARTLVNQ